jgi:hypothetical protein
VVSTGFHSVISNYFRLDAMLLTAGGGIQVPLPLDVNLVMEILPSNRECGTKISQWTVNFHL